MTGYYIAQVSLQSRTNLPKDRFVNTFHFLGDGDDVGRDCLGIATKLADYYTTPSAGGSQKAIDSFLAGSVDDHVTINIYDAAQEKPRTPNTFHFLLQHQAPQPGGQRLPEQIALCMSFFSVRNVPHMRNRIYLGPFNTLALGEAGVTVTSRPNPDLLVAIAEAGHRLTATDNGGAGNASNAMIDGLFLAGLAGVPGAPSLPSFLQKADFPAANTASWVVHSPHGGLLPANMPGAWSFVTNGWVDNEWDGQSRRRIDSSARVTFVD